jgi:predicted ATPase/class 3 adenylate cyclase
MATELDSIRREPASRTLTFLFTDIEGSTARWEKHPEAMRVALARHDALLRQTIERRGGHVFKTVGDAFCAAFPVATDALDAALDAQRALAAEAWGEVGPIRVRMALQSGAAELRDGDYFGPPLNRVARLLSAGHGGQVLLALPTEELVRDGLPDGASLRDLGEHRLKDLIRPERIFQLVDPELPDEFPQLRTLDQRPNNLPIQATPFVGRENVVAAVREELIRPDVRLLTLTGPGGTGKTRLGLQVAAELLDEFEDGVFFVSLAPTSDPTLVAAAIAQALGVQETAGRPVLAALKDYLRDRHLLLMLDNFEQVLDAAEDVARLPASCPRLKILVTSRSILHLYGAHNFPVPPLELPDPRRLPPIARLTQYEAVRLFVERAQAVRPDFQVTNANAPAVAEICHRLDGLPLAIELAAARVRLLSPEAILARMERRLPLLTGGARDLPARQQTLRGAIMWGHDLLDPAEQALFRRLAVFVDGFTLEAAEDVVRLSTLNVQRGDSVWSAFNVEPEPLNDLEIDVFDGVASLVDQSWLIQHDTPAGEPRFSMLGTIREFGLDRLDESGEAAEVRDRHAAWFREMSAGALKGLRGPEQLDWLARLDPEHRNLKAALDWLGRQGRHDERMVMAANLWWFWGLRAQFSEGIAWIEESLASDPGAAPSLGRALALFAVGALANLKSDFALSMRRLEESVEMGRALGEQIKVAYPLIFLGSAHLMSGDPAGAAPFYDEGIAVARRIGDDWATALGLTFKASLAFGAGDSVEARSLAEDGVRLFRGTGDRWGTSLARAILGRIVVLEGEFEMARICLEDSLEFRRLIGDRWGAGQTLNGLGEVDRAAGDLLAARAAFEQALELFIETGYRAGIAGIHHNLGRVALSQGLWERAGALFREGLTEYVDVSDRRGVADCLAGLAGVAAAEGDGARAARLFGTSEALLESIDATVWPTNRADYERDVAAARALLEPTAFAEIWAEGRRIADRPIDQVARALTST